MTLRAKLFAFAVTVCVAIVILSTQGCFSSESDLPASSIQEGMSEDAAAVGQGINHQPTILRAEVAAPPISGGSSDEPASSSSPEPRPSERPISATGNPHIADLLPIPSLDAPPSQR